MIFGILFFFRLDDNLSQAVEDCLKAAGIVHDPEHQKTLMKAAQFGTAFCKINTPNSSQWVIIVLNRKKKYLKASVEI